MSKKNLIIVYREPGNQDDFEDIAHRVNALDPSITIYHLPAYLRAELPDEAWRFPTLTVALAPEFKLPVKRGPVLRNYLISKITQHRIFLERGIPTPPTLEFRFGMNLDPIMFGEFVLLKPANLALTSSGDGVHVMRRSRAEVITPQAFSPDHPIRNNNTFLVQRFIFTGAQASAYRVSTFLGEVLYTWRSQATATSPDLSSADHIIEAADFTQKQDKINMFDVNDDVVNLGRQVALAFPDVPLLGIDIIKDVRSSRYYVLEVNAGGNTWHFSSERWAERRVLRPDWAKAMKEQFSAFDVAARVLAEKVRLLAA